MRAMKVFVPVAILAGFVFCATTSFGKPAYATKEKKACTFCHAKSEPANKEAMAKNLNDAGKYYAAHDHSLDGYKGK
jgi:hypothetical protein